MSIVHINEATLSMIQKWSPNSSSKRQGENSGKLEIQPATTQEELAAALP